MNILVGGLGVAVSVASVMGLFQIIRAPKHGSLGKELRSFLILSVAFYGGLLLAYIGFNTNLLA